MKYPILFLTFIFLIIVVATFALSNDKNVKSKDTKTPPDYPIAPGVWYPGDGPLPEKPMRYYRVRCWPGCHRGSAYGKYPNRPLPMTPIFPTRAAMTPPAALRGKK